MKHKEILVYVEGPSDEYGMEKLLDPIINHAAQKGNIVKFIPMGGKNPLLNKGLVKAVSILRNSSNRYVFLVPDLYPPNTPPRFKHTSFAELKSKLEEEFLKELKRKECDPRLKDRFRVHCFKYDLEVLLLASENILMDRLEITKFPPQIKWTKPVEDQDHGRSPKKIVESLFEKCGKKYKDTVDVPWILERSDYNQLKSTCSQQFKPFLNDLLEILDL